jgi:tetratricopeptide (TPR) repeat protein
MTDEELEKWLTAPVEAVDPLRKVELLESSKRALPGRSRWLWGAVAVGLFLQGIAVGWVCKPTPVITIVSEPLPVIEYETVPVPILIPPEPAPPGPTYFTSAELDKMEQAAEIAPAPKAADIYRELGDYYLQQEDFVSATRCYRQHMNHLPREGLAYSSSDSWLLLELKIARKKGP